MSAQNDIESAKKITTLKVENKLVHGAFIRCLQFVKNGGEGYLYLKMVGQDIIHQFKLDESLTFKHIKEYSFDLHGPNGIRTSSTMFHILDDLSIVVFSMAGLVHYFNPDGQKLKQIEYKQQFISDFDINGVPEVFGGQIYSDGHSNLFSSTAGGSFEYTVNSDIYHLNLDTRESDWILKDRASILNNKYYGTSNANFYTHATYNRNTKELVISIPNRHDLYIYEVPVVNNKRKTKSSRSKHIKSNFPALSNRVKKNSEVEEFKFNAKTGFYAEIDYNQHSNIYYRNVYAPYPIYNSWDDAYKNPHLMVLDDNLKILHEVRVPERHKGYFRFFSDQGICLFDEEQWELSEDYFEFTCYDFTD